MRYTRLLEGVESKIKGKVNSRRYSLPEMISESYRTYYNCKDNSNLKKLAEAHLADVRSNPTEIERLSLQLCNIKHLAKMVESMQIKDQELLVPEEKYDTVEPKKKEEIDEAKHIYVVFPEKDGTSYAPIRVKAKDEKDAIAQAKKHNRKYKDYNWSAELIESVEEEEVDEGIFGGGKHTYSVFPEKDGQHYAPIRVKAKNEKDAIAQAQKQNRKYKDYNWTAELIESVDDDELEEGIFDKFKRDNYTKDLVKRMKALTQDEEGSSKDKKKSGKSVASWKVVQTTGARLTVADGFTSEYEAAEYVKNHGGVSKLKVVKESTETEDDLLEDTDLTDEELAELTKHLEEMRKNKKVAESTKSEDGDEEEKVFTESKSYESLNLSEFAKKSSSKAFVKTFKKLNTKLHEGTALTRQESISLYKAANSAMTHLSVELEHNPEFLDTFRESAVLLSADTNKLLESLKKGKAPSKSTMKSLAKFSEALLREEDEEELPPIEDEENGTISEEEEEFLQDYADAFADAREEMHNKLADKYEDSKDPGVQERLEKDAAEIAMLKGEEEEESGEGNVEPSEDDKEVTPDDEIPESADPEKDLELDEAEEDDSEITDEELEALKKHLKEMREAKKDTPKKVVEGRKLRRPSAN